MVARTRWARADYDWEKLAPHLGVQVDVLRDARARHGERPVVETCAFVLQMPEQVWKDWKRVCAHQDLEGGLALRGLVQSLLLNAKRPTWIGKGWMYRGRRVRMAGVSHGENWPWKQKTMLSRGADRALSAIAEELKTTKTALVRGQLLDYLEGKAPRIILMSAEDMSNDPHRYTRLWGIK